MQFTLPNLRFKMPVIYKPTQTVSWDKFFHIYREPVVTYSITPNNSPEQRKSPSGRGGGRMGGRGDDIMDFESLYSNSNTSDAILNVISGLFSRFYLPERVRFEKWGVKVKLNDIVSYKVVFQNGNMKFYLTVPQKWAKSFTNAIKRDWGQVDITKISEEIIKFNPDKAKAMEIILRHHHSLAFKHDRKIDNLYPALASIGDTLSVEDKMILDFNIEPTNEIWKADSSRKLREFKSGKIPKRNEPIWNVNSWISHLFGFTNLIFEETTNAIKDLMGAEKNEDKSEQQPFDIKYSQEKLHANAKGYNVQIRAIAESTDHRKSKYMLKNLQNAFEMLDGDNKFVVKHIKTRRGVKSIIEAVDKNSPQMLRPKDTLFDGEMNQLMKLPNKTILREYKSLIEQDNFTRTEIHEDFFNPNHHALSFAKTIDKDSKVVYFPGYKREWWTEKGRRTEKKTEIDDRSTVTLLWGRQGSGKTELTVGQIVETFGITMFEEYNKLVKQSKDRRNFNDDERKNFEQLAEQEIIVVLEKWKEHSKSVVAFDVADGEILTKVWNLIPAQIRHRVVILNHAVPERPIPVNFAEMEEFNRTIMKDPDYAFKLSEMEANLIGDILETGNSILVNRWLGYALQCAHTASPDYGIPEGIRLLIDDEFRINDIMPKVSHDEELMLHMETYNEMRNNGETTQIITAIQNRLSQLSSDRKLWDCIAQRPLRDEEGNCQINFRKWMDGDQDGAYLVLVYIPKEGVSKQFRKFLFAHYLLKVWNVTVSREKGFAGREYRPETLVVVDEVHQIIDVPTIAQLFIDLFKEPRKYSVRLFFTLHGWSSLALAGRDIAGKIKQSIMDNGANLIMLKGGEEAFDSLSNFMGDMTIDDYNNLMRMDFCGIFSIWWKGQANVFQAKLLPPATERFPAHDSWDLYTLAEYVSPYSRYREDVRKENLDRVKNMLKKAMRSMATNGDDVPDLKEGTDWNDLKPNQAATKPKRSPRRDDGAN